MWGIGGCGREREEEGGGKLCSCVFFFFCQGFCILCSTAYPRPPFSSIAVCFRSTFPICYTRRWGAYPCASGQGGVVRGLRFSAFIIAFRSVARLVSPRSSSRSARSCASFCRIGERGPRAGVPRSVELLCVCFSTASGVPRPVELLCVSFSTASDVSRPPACPPPASRPILLPALDVRCKTSRPPLARVSPRPLPPHFTPRQSRAWPSSRAPSRRCRRPCVPRSETRRPRPRPARRRRPCRAPP